jgi:hypothetical protein
MIIIKEVLGEAKIKKMAVRGRAVSEHSYMHRVLKAWLITELQEGLGELTEMAST